MQQLFRELGVELQIAGQPDRVLGTLFAVDGRFFFADAKTRCCWVYGWIMLLGMLLTGSVSGQSTNVSAVVEVSEEPALVGDSVIYTISVTNISGFSFTDFIVTNTLPTSFTFLSATNNFGVVSASGNIVRLVANVITNNAVVVLAIASKPTALGVFTNRVSFTSVGAFIETTNLEFTTTVVSGLSDIAVRMSGPVDTPLVHELVSYKVTVTNAGPTDASTVYLTNRFPVDLLFQSISPSNSSVTLTTTNVVVSVGTLAAGSSLDYIITYRPTNSGVLVLSSRVQASNLDTNLNDNVWASALTVSPALTATLSLALLDPTPVLDRQTGLMSQSVRVSNTGGTTALGVRVLVSGLTTRLTGIPDQLWNAVGTNAGVPFVLSGSPLLPGNSVDLLLEFFFPTRTPAGGLTITPVPALTPTLSTSTNSSFAITSATLLSPGRILIEFPAVLGDRYAVIYSADTSFTNVFLAQPTLVAPGSKVLWLDDGPPKTLSAPTSVSSRYYRVIHNP